MTIELDQTVLALGHSLGRFGEQQNHVRLGATNHQLDDAQFSTWALARGPAAAQTGGELWPGWTVRSVVGWGARPELPVAEVIEGLVDQGLVAVLPLGAGGDRARVEFAANHRLVPLMCALGNTPRHPDMFWLGRLGAEVLWVPAAMGLVWQLSPLFPSLADAVTAAAQLGEIAEPDLLDLVFGVLPRLLAEDLAQLDTRWDGPLPPPFTGRLLPPPGDGPEPTQLFPIGQFSGTIYDPETEKPGEQSARVGSEDVALSDELGAVVWHLVHTARTRTDLRSQFADWVTETGAAPADPEPVLDRLIDAGLVAEVRPMADETVEFSRRYRVQYLHSGLDADSYGVLYTVGIIGGESLASLHWLGADLWWRSADTRSLWETYERMAEEARKTGSGPPRQVDPRWVAQAALSSVGTLVSTGTGYLDLAR